MLKEIKHWQKMIAIVLVLLMPTLLGCSVTKPYYINDSDRIFVGMAETQPPIPYFDWVCMSKGQYRTLTTLTNSI